jgi:hypothetical protein
MLSRFIVATYELLLEICLWLTLIGSFIVGWSIGGPSSAFLFLLITFVTCVAVFGAFLTIIDIRKSVRVIEGAVARAESNSEAPISIARPALLTGGDLKRSTETVEVKCPNCQKSEAILADESNEDKIHELFTAKASPFFTSMVMYCKSCGKKFRWTAKYGSI